MLEHIAIAPPCATDSMGLSCRRDIRFDQETQPIITVGTNSFSLSEKRMAFSPREIHENHYSILNGVYAVMRSLLLWKSASPRILPEDWFTRAWRFKYISFQSLELFGGLTVSLFHQSLLLSDYLQLATLAPAASGKVYNLKSSIPISCNYHGNGFIATDTKV